MTDDELNDAMNDLARDYVQHAPSMRMALADIISTCGAIMARSLAYVAFDEGNLLDLTDTVQMHVRSRAADIFVERMQRRRREAGR